MSLAADVVLVCTGRIGDAGPLGLASVGVRTDARGFVQVDGRYRTSVPHVSAAGDAIGFPALASASREQARAAVGHAFDAADARGPVGEGPYAVWTIPEIAIVGQTEGPLAARGVPCETGSASFRLTARGQILGDTDGFVKLLFHPEDRRLLGVTIVGEGACELIHLGMSVMGFGGTIDYFVDAPFGEPTLAEAYRQAAHDGLQRLRRRHARQPGLPAVPRPVLLD
jgi:NAD(P) transhydrogenase